MERNIPRAAIHVGTDKKSFSSQVGNEAERRGWNEKRYQLKNADIDKNNHYNYSRKRLNFEIVKGGKIVPLGSLSVPLHERLQHRLDELGFKPYMDAKRPDQVSRNSPNCTVGIIFSGDHDVLNRLAFGEQKLNTSDPNADHSKVVLQKGIYDWALDTYRFACEKWGEDNVIGFDVHCDETSIHAHVQTVPVEQVRKRGRIGSKYIHKDKPEKVLSTKEWRALPKEERDNYTKSEAAKDVVERVSYAKRGESEQRTNPNTFPNCIQTITTRLGVSMAWQEVSPMMNFQRKRNEDASIRIRWCLKLNVRRKSLLTKWKNMQCLPQSTRRS